MKKWGLGAEDFRESDATLPAVEVKTGEPHGDTG